MCNKYDNDCVLFISFFTIKEDKDHILSIKCNENGSVFSTHVTVCIIQGLMDVLTAIARGHKGTEVQHYLK